MNLFTSISISIIYNYGLISDYDTIILNSMDLKRILVNENF